MAKVYYSEEHEWVRVEDDNTAVIGITDYAQQQLGDIVFVELPDVDKELDKGDEAAVIESVKAASEAYAVVSGTVSEVNEALADTPNLVNEAAESDGWFFKLTLKDTSELDALMDKEGYDQFIKGLD